MVAVAVRDNSGYGSSCHGMYGIKATGVDRIMSAVEEAICVRTVARVLQQLLSASDDFEGEVEPFKRYDSPLPKVFGNA
jgi:hypothetical protein